MLLNVVEVMAAIGTWGFSYSAVREMRDLIMSGQHATDVVERAMAGELR